MHYTCSPVQIERASSEEDNVMECNSPATSPDDVAVQPETSVKMFNFNTSMLGKGYLGRKKGRLGANRHLRVQGDDSTALSDDGSEHQFSPHDVEEDENAMGQRRRPWVDKQMSPYSSSGSAGGSAYVHDPREPRCSLSSQMYTNQCLPMEEDSPTSIGMGRSVGGPRYPTMHGHGEARSSFSNQMSDGHWLPMDDVLSPEENPRSIGMEQSFGEQRYMYPTGHRHREARSSFSNQMDPYTYPNAHDCSGSFGGSIQGSSRNFVYEPGWDHHPEGISSAVYSGGLSRWAPWKGATAQGNSNARHFAGQYSSNFAESHANHAWLEPGAIVHDESEHSEYTGNHIEYGGYAMGNPSKATDGLKSCPVPGCRQRVKNPGRHIEQYHRMSKEASRLYRNHVKVKALEQHRPRSTSGRLVETYKPCPICGEPFKRVMDHIRRMHKQEQGSNGDADGDSDGVVLARGEIEEPEGTGGELEAAAETDTETMGVSRVSEEGGGDWHQEQSENFGQECDEPETGYAPHMPSEEEPTPQEDDNASQRDGIVHSKKIKYKVDQEVLSLLAKFKAWVAAPIGTSLSSTTIGTYVPGCGRCIEFLGGTIKSIRNYERIGKPGGLMDQMKNNKKMARTTRTMLYGMLKLMEYLMMSNHPVFTPNEAATAYHTMQNFAISLRKPVQEEKEDRKIKGQQQVEELIPIIANYEATEHYKKVKSIFDKASRGKHVSKADLLDMRAYLITQLLAKNGHRTGVIANCLMSHYREAVLIGTCYQISVRRHKTSTGGPAILTVPKDMWKELTVYISQRRKYVGGGEHDGYLFPTTPGTKMQSTSIIGSLKRALKKKTTVNTIRALHVVIADEQRATPQQMTALAKQMCHSTKVQEAYYSVGSAQRNAAAATDDMTSRLNQYKACI